jgi:hypothetical protein
MFNTLPVFLFFTSVVATSAAALSTVFYLEWGLSEDSQLSESSSTNLNLQPNLLARRSLGSVEGSSSAEPSPQLCPQESPSVGSSEELVRDRKGDDTTEDTSEIDDSTSASASASENVEVERMLKHIPSKLHKLHACGYAYTGGMIGSCSVLFGKTVAEMMKGIFRAVPDWSAWGTYQFWLFVIAMAVTLILQIRFLNTGLKYHDSMIVVPVYQTFWILGGIIGGGTYFKEFEGMSSLNIALFVTGVCVTLVGVQLLTYNRRNHALEDESAAAAASMAPEGIGITHFEDVSTTRNASVKEQQPGVEVEQKGMQSQTQV